jgi:uncharacterized protein
VTSSHAPAAAAMVACLAAALCLSTGCSTYANRVAKVRNAFYQGNLPAAAKLVDESLAKGGGEADVLRLESAMIQLASGRPRDAEQSLRLVRDHFDHLDQTNVAESALAALTDDKRRAYAGEDYEKVLIRALLAVSSLMHDGTDAEAYSLQMIETQERIINGGSDRRGDNPKLKYQRVALAPYLRGVLREETHLDYDDAARSFASVVSWRPEFLAGKLDVERATHGRHSEPGHGVLYLFAFTGRGPFKEESAEVVSSASLLVAGEIISAVGKQTVPPNIAPVKVPRIRSRANPVQGVALSINGQTRGFTETLTDVSLMARQQCDALLTRTVARAVARRVVKMGIVYTGKEAAGLAKNDVANLAFDVAGIAWQATESADTRCWGLLPDKIQVLRLELPEGDHDVSLIPVSSSRHTIGPPARQRIRIDNGRNTYALAMFPGEKVVGQVLVSGGPARR